LSFFESSKSRSNALQSFQADHVLQNNLSCSLIYKKTLPHLRDALEAAPEPEKLNLAEEINLMLASLGLFSKTGSDHNKTIMLLLHGSATWDDASRARHGAIGQNGDNKKQLQKTHVAFTGMIQPGPYLNFVNDATNAASGLANRFDITVTDNWHYKLEDLRLDLTARDMGLDNLLKPPQCRTLIRNRAPRSRASDEASDDIKSDEDDEDEKLAEDDEALDALAAERGGPELERAAVEDEVRGLLFTGLQTIDLCRNPLRDFNDDVVQPWS
jgi:hypothetical protein